MARDPPTSGMFKAMPTTSWPRPWIVRPVGRASSVSRFSTWVWTVELTSTTGAAVQTVEGIAQPDQLHPVQKTFLEEAALQCGFCTPGVLVAAKALLDRNPDPTETEIRYWLAGNLCRCTGYDKIVRAVEKAAAEMRGEAK